MKKWTAIIAAALILMSVSTGVSAEPSETAESTIQESITSDADETSSEQTEKPSEVSEEPKNESSLEESDKESSAEESSSENSDEKSSQDESSKESSKQEESKKEESKKEEPKKEESGEEESKEEKTEKLKYTDYTLENMGMHIKLPENMYTVTRDTKEDAEVFKAYKKTKEEMMKNFSETDTYIKASAEDFSYDITVTMLKNENTKTIDNLLSISDADVQDIVDNLLKQPMYTGCSRTKYNNTLFLSLSMDYTSGETEISGKQEYTIVKGTKVIITFQSYTGKIDDSFGEIVSEVMDSVTFDGINPNPENSEAKSLNLNNLDVRYIYLMVLAGAALLTLMLMIITAMRYKKSKMPEESESKDIKQENKKSKKEKKEKKKQKPEQTVSEIKPESEKVENTLTFENQQKLQNTGESRFMPFLDSPITQDRENNGFTDSSQPKKTGTVDISQAEISDMTDSQETAEVVFAESVPKHSDIEQVPSSKEETGSVEETPKPIQEQSAYERRFGRERRTSAPTITNEPSLSETVPTEERTSLSKFERRFGRPSPRIRAMEKSETGLEEEKRPENEIYKAEEEKPKDATVSLDIVKSEDGSIVIGASSGKKPLDVEIKAIEDIKAEETRKMAEIGMTPANENEIYNSAEEERKRENPKFVAADRKSEDKTEKAEVQSEAETEGEISQFEKKFGKKKPVPATTVNRTATTNETETSEEKTAEEKKDNVSQDKDESSKSGETESEGFFDGVKAESKSGGQEKMKQNSTAGQPRSGFVFERDTGIVFERGPSKRQQIKLRKIPFTTIPRLESVNAEAYNQQFAELIKSMPKNLAYSNRFGTEQQTGTAVSSTPKPTAPRPAPPKQAKPTEQTAVSQVPKTSAKPKPQQPKPQKTAEVKTEDKPMEYYTGYTDKKDDPFTDETYKTEEMVIKSRKKKSDEPFGVRFKRTFEKLFAGGGDDEEDDDEE